MSLARCAATSGSAVSSTQIRWWQTASSLAFAAALGCGLLAPHATQAKEAQEAPASSSGSVTGSTEADIIAFINAQIQQGWKEGGIKGSPKASDLEWCRRVYLDVIGRVPTPEELKEFTQLSGDRKSKLMEKLLESDKYVEEYARNFMTVWTNVLIGRPPARPDREPTNREGMQQYLRRSFLENKPYDKMVIELVSATGTTKPGQEGYNGASNFLVGKLKEGASEATSRTARYFLGMQVQCTQCHNHPFNDWKQDQYWGMNAFFKQTAMREHRQGASVEYSDLENHDFRGDDGSTPEKAETYYELRNGQMQVAYPKFVDGTLIDPNGYVNKVDRRAELAKLIVKNENFGKAIVNRLWAHFLGYGFTKPIDDIGPHNQSSHPELFDRLGKEFANNGHDLRKLIRWVTLSEAYALSSKVVGKNSKDDPSLGEKPKFSHFYLRQMQAEQLYESLAVMTQKKGTDPAEHERTKAAWMQQFTVTFGNDEGDDATTFNGTIPQALMLMNGEMVKSATSVEAGTFLNNLANNGQQFGNNVEYMYLSLLARKPSGGDFGAMAQAGLTARGDVLTAYQDIMWALLNCNEFIFIH